MTDSLIYTLLTLLVALLLVPLSLVQLLYLEALRLRPREGPAMELFKERLEARIGLRLEEGALAFSVMKHALFCALAIFLFISLEHPDPKLHLPSQPLALLAVEALALSSVLMLFLGHMLPQLLYRKTPGAFLMPLAPALRGMALASWPLLATLRFMRDVADLSSPEETDEESSETEQQIEALITAGKEEGIIAEEDRKLIQSAVEFGDKTVREVMTPRNDIVSIEANASLDQLRELAVRERYSRFPATNGTIDDIIGFVHVRDMFELDEASRAGKKVRSIMRTIELLPETKPVDDVLRLMQEDGQHMVVVIDEYGNTAGLATMEDLVEEIVGEIRDEHEPEMDAERQVDGSWIVSGNLDVDRLDDLFDFRPGENTESTTIGGLVTEWLGHMPAAGAVAEREGLRIEVLSASGRRVSQVRVWKQGEQPTGERTQE